MAYDTLQQSSRGAAGSTVAIKSPPNQTAYRVFCLLLWLFQEGPLSLTDLQHRYQTLFGLAEPPSDDTIRLYANTLKALGCEMVRPSPKNQFTYGLVKHPFWPKLNATQTTRVLACQQWAENTLPTATLIALTQLVETAAPVLDPAIVATAMRQPAQNDTPSEMVSNPGRSKVIAQLQAATTIKAALLLSYQSPSKGPTLFYFKADSLVWLRDSLYVFGWRLHYNDLSMLRVDRILSVDRAPDDPFVLDGVSPPQHPEPIAVCWPMTGRQFELTVLPILEQYHIPYSLSFTDNAAGEEQVQTTFRTYNRFLAQQALLETEQPFSILSPASFRAQLQETLLNTLMRYKGRSGVSSDTAGGVSLHSGEADTVVGDV